MVTVPHDCQISVFGMWEMEDEFLCRLGCGFEGQMATFEEK